MIISASRRTDIPAYYAEWFCNRIKEGYLYVRNPMNSHQISEITLSPQLIDCIVFWTKNPLPMLLRLDDLRDYPYYFQFSLTGYGRDIEPAIPDKRNVMIPAFRQLSSMIGKERVIWRYDPILFTDRYTVAYHLKAFREIASSLKGYTDKAVISFVDVYSKTKRNMKGIAMMPLEDCLHEEGLDAFLKELSCIARENHMKIASCAEHMDMGKYGIEHNSCIDKELIERITGYRINAHKDKNQRKECGCIESVEVGTYHTCTNGCKYCYANDSERLAYENARKYNPHAPMLCGEAMPGAHITKRVLKSLRT